MIKIVNLYFIGFDYVFDIFFFDEIEKFFENVFEFFYF